MWAKIMNRHLQKGSANGNSSTAVFPLPHKGQQSYFFTQDHIYSIDAVFPPYSKCFSTFVEGGYSTTRLRECSLSLAVCDW